MKKILIILSSFLLGCLTCLSGVQSVPSAPLPNELESLAEMRVAGLHQDKTVLPSLISAVASSHDAVYNLTALAALARMGTVEALPKIELLEKSNDLTVANFAKASEARLIAEYSVSSIFDGTLRAKPKIDKFYEVLNLLPSEINTGTAKYYENLKTNPQGAENGSATPVEVYAMREVADMVYSGNYQSYVLLPTVSQLNFARDYPSALKMRLAPLSGTQRISTMIHDLANKQKLATSDDYEIQLLSDEGLPASQAIAIQLQQMGQDRQDYKSAGFAALFRTLEAIGDPEQASVVEQFLHDQDGDVGYFARQVYYNIKSRLRQERVLEY